MAIQWNLPTNYSTSSTFTIPYAPAYSVNPFSVGSLFSYSVPSFVLNPYSSVFQFPKFNFFTSIPTSTPRYTSSRTTSTLSSNNNGSAWQRLGYSAQKGLNLVRAALSNARGFVGRCAAYVKTAISRVGLGAYKSGHAYNMTSILKDNKNFKEISVASAADLKKLPAGCILVYDKGVSGYNKTYGHVEITTGDGRAVSDGITRNIRAGARVFMPVA